MSTDKKPERLSRTIVYQSPWVNLYLDTVVFHNGRVIENHHLLDFERDSVTAVVENEVGSALFVRISRYTTGATNWELPAGGVEPGESVLAAVQREVLEETGYTSTKHKLIYSYYPMDGIANKVFHIVHCRAGDRQSAFDTAEVSAMRWFTKDEIRQMIEAREITDGFSLTALLLWLN